MRKLRIAIADDERDVRDFLRETLVRQGHDVSALAATGEQLLQEVRSSPVDLVIIDSRLSADSGDVAAALNREHPVPVILVSPHHDAETLSRIAVGHVMEYLLKPIAEADLKKGIALALLRFQHCQALKKEVGDLRASLEDRKIIERAKGIIMKRTQVGEEEAFRRLRKLASDQNIKLVEIGRRVNAAGAIFQELDDL